MTLLSRKLKDIRSRIVTDIERATGKKVGRRGDVYYPISQALTGAVHGLYQKLAYTEDQLFDQTCSDENLLRRAAEYGINRIGAFKASGTITITGNDDVVLPANSQFKKNDVIYFSGAGGTIRSGSAIIFVEAVKAGAAANQAVGETLTLTTTIAGIDTQATVIEISGGADAEKIERVRERLLSRKQNPPMGGNANDYVEWAKAAHPDVTRAWCYPNENGLGTVVVRVVTDDLPNIIPSQTIRDAVKNYTDKVRPAGMRGFVVGQLGEKKLDITFTKLVPNTEAVRKAVEAQLDDTIRRNAVPGGTILISQIRAAISAASGETDHAININSDITSAPTELIVLGTLAWPA